MKQKKFTKTLLCLILSALVLSSCVNGEGSDADLSQDVSNLQSSAESSENLSNENSTEDVSEAVSEDSSDTISEDISSEIDPKDFPYRDSEIYPGDDAKIIFGKDFPMSTSLMLNGFRCSHIFYDLLADKNNDDAYYYVCLDFRDSYRRHEEEIKDFLEKAKVKTEQIGEEIFVSYVTKQNINYFQYKFSEIKPEPSFGLYLADASLNEETYKKITEGHIPFEQPENLSFLPPKDAAVLYGTGKVPMTVEGVTRGFGGFDLYEKELKPYFDDPKYDGAYYYFCFDTSRSYFTTEEELAYYASFGVKCEKYESVLFAYATEEQLIALKNDRGFAPHCEAIWLTETAKEEYKEQLDLLRTYE